ncbi:MAG: NAD(P)H-hydrate dehydratase [Chloroflexi bacterium]|nr:NAD(P)H-hydrate dehydratase [Chloroflexota bacterium]
MKLVTVSEMREIELEASTKGLDFEMMMENAGHGLADEIALLAHTEDTEREVLGLVGSGNNGGDTLIALAHLAANGWLTRAYVVHRKIENDVLVERLRKEGGEIILEETDSQFDNLSAFVSTADVIVDGILGTGVQLPLRDDIVKVLNAVNKAIGAVSWPPYVVAVDCPSGVNCDTGEAADEVIPASLTVCMAAVKVGLLRFPAFDLAGELRVADIGLGDQVISWLNVKNFVADDEIVEDYLPLRPSDSHKGTFGTAMVVAGSINYIGAPLLAGKAAYRIGVGLVQLAVPGQVQLAIAGQFPEATWIVLPQELGVISDAGADVLVKNIDRATAILIGPGFGIEDTTKTFIENMLNGKVGSKKTTGRIGFTQSEFEKKSDKNIPLPSMVVDADGLRLLSKIEGWPKLLPNDSILTPHPGEMASLTGLDKEAIQADRLGVALKFASEWGHVVVLKGAFTVVAAPNGRATLIPVATSALARAGTGDVLAGLIVGLRAQGVNSYEAAVAGAWIHAQAGLYAAEKIGAEASVMASDVLDAVADVLSVF